MPNFDVQPGVVSAVYFILFDLFLLALLDIVLARYVNSRYYRQVNEGRAIPIKSVDIPGVTTFLVGRIFSLPNLLALAVKLGFLACILIIDLAIDAEVIRPKTLQRRSATFDFDPAPAQWTDDTYRIVERAWEISRRCRRTNTTTGEIDFYALSFDLKGNQLLPSEVVNEEPLLEEYIPFVPGSIICSKPGAVETPVPLASVVGCSQVLYPTTCQNFTNDKRVFEWDIPPTNQSNASQGKNYKLGFVIMPPEVSSQIWPEYPNASVHCLLMRVGDRVLTAVRRVMCMINVIINSNTLLERWEFDEVSFTFNRRYPGANFKGEYDIALDRVLILLEDLSGNTNWESLSGSFIADTLVYRQVNQSISVFEEARTVTTVPGYAIGIAVGMVIVAVFSRVVVAFTIGKDLRPQLNSIDGLSSIAREEHQPTGRSYVGGRGMLMGLSPLGGRGLDVVHLGPLRSITEGVRRSIDARIE